VPIHDRLLLTGRVNLAGMSEADPDRGEGEYPTDLTAWRRMIESQMRVLDERVTELFEKGSPAQRDEIADRRTRADSLGDEFYDLAMRVLWLEHRAGEPMSIVDEIMAKSAREERRRPFGGGRRFAEYNKAMAEAERIGHREPIDEFVRRLRAGEFDQ
jgi:hypothetical protein